MGKVELFNVYLPSRISTLGLKPRGEGGAGVMTFYIYCSVKVLGLESHPCLNTTLCNIFAKINLKIVVQENYELI